MTFYAYYKDNQFRIIPEGLMPNFHEGFQKNGYGNEYNKALQHAKDQTEPAEDQSLILKLVVSAIEKGIADKPIKEDTIYPFEFEGTVEIVEVPEIPGFDHTSYPTFKKVARLTPYVSPQEKFEKDMIQSFEKYIDNLPDEKFDKIVADIDSNSAHSSENPDNSKPDFEAIAKKYADSWVPELNSSERSLCMVSVIHGCKKLYSDIYLPKVREMGKMSSEIITLLQAQGTQKAYCQKLEDENQELRDKIKTLEEEKYEIQQSYIQDTKDLRSQIDCVIDLNSPTPHSIQYIADTYGSILTKK